MSAVCTHVLWGDLCGLVCTRTDAHVTGHTYRSFDYGEDS